MRTRQLAFLGLPCAASAAALEVVLAGGPVETIILAGAPGAVLSDPERLAAGSGVPVRWVASAAEARDVLRAVKPELAVAACFPWRLPRAARHVPLLGILNIHPSLLPAGRGPRPVFWTLRRGEQQAGVTIHLMDDGFDTGPLLVQEAAPIPPGIRATDLENALMARGARLLLDAVLAFAAGELVGRPQPADGASHAPEPAAADWTMPSTLPAAWAWRFARGVAPLGGPLTALAGGQSIPVADALDWSPNESPSQSVRDEPDGTVRVRFSPGWVRFQRRPG